ncbi:hypothetical protein ACQP0C_37375 [Nocardia sp. CA-129566]|uniref:hypothetical protein n=1 Tax=Nocardia sp. CA-129566 TaxID=3239976 RepID=UPI003D99DBFD
MIRSNSAGRVRPLIARVAVVSAMALTPIAAVVVPALAEPAPAQEPAIVLVEQGADVQQGEEIHGHHGYGGWDRGGWDRGGWGLGGWDRGGWGLGGWGNRIWPGYPGYWPGYPGIWPGYIPMPSTGSAI